MAITSVQALTSCNHNSAFNLGSTSTDKLAVVITPYWSDNDVTAVTIGGTSCTLFGTQSTADSTGSGAQPGMKVWYLLNPGDGNKTLLITGYNTQPVGCFVVAGANTTTPLGAGIASTRLASPKASGDFDVTTISSPNVSDWAFFAFGIDDNTSRSSDIGSISSTVAIGAGFSATSVFGANTADSGGNATGGFTWDSASTNLSMLGFAVVDGSPTGSGSSFTPYSHIS